MVPFDLAEPKTLADAIKLLDPDDPTVQPPNGRTVGSSGSSSLMASASVFGSARSNGTIMSS